MKAAIFHGAHQPLTIEDVTVSNPQSREVLIRTAAVGVCHSDLHYIDGLYYTQAPSILGHEASGVVEKTGSEVSYVKPGDHVITCLSVFCGHCEYCVTGRLFSCQNPETSRHPDSKPRLSQDGKTIVISHFNPKSGQGFVPH